MAKAVSNEEIIAALLQHGSMKKAADAAGVSVRTIYDRFRSDNEFRGMYSEAKTEIFRKALIEVNNHLSGAISNVADIMSDKKNNAAVRLQAAQTIINNVHKLGEHLKECESYTRSEGDKDIEIF